MQRADSGKGQTVLWRAIFSTGWGLKKIEAWYEDQTGRQKCFAIIIAFRLCSKRNRLYAGSEYQRLLCSRDWNESELQTGQGRAENFHWRPLVSVLVPTYNTDPIFLRRAIESVQAQHYDHWELCIADDGSTREHTREALRAFAAEDPRIRVVFRPRNGHIAAASNSALGLASGEFVALLDHDDELAPAALARMVEAINRDPGLRFLYSDEDKIDPGGGRGEPYFKPDWNPTLLRSQNYVCHLAFIARADLEAVGGFREGTEGCQDWDLFLRLGEYLPVTAIRHVPSVLYHWRMIPGSTALNVGEKHYVVDRARRILEEHEGKGAAVGSWKKVAGMYWVHHPEPAVDFRLVPVSGSGPVGDLPATSSLDTVLVFHPEPCRPDSATTALLAGWASRRGTGMVGGALRRSDGGIGEAGLLLQRDGSIDPLFRDLPPNFRGMGRRELLPQELVVPGRYWFAVRAGLWDQGGERDRCWTFQVAYRAIDLWRKGFRNILIPSLSCSHVFGQEILTPRESADLLAWAPDLCRRDPASHPFLTTRRGCFELLGEE